MNVGAVWLWWRFHVDVRLHDHGDRINGFVTFGTPEQFTSEIQALAQAAAAEVLQLRSKFRSLQDTGRELIAASPHKDWLLYHAAIAAGLMEDWAGARQLFDQLKRRDRVSDQQRVEGRLATLIDRPEDYRSHLLNTIASSREACRLPPDPNCLGDA